MVNPIAFGLAVFEETISKPFVAQVMQDIEETMFMRMEFAKSEGLNKVREVASENQMTGYYELLESISQQKHDEVFAGKIKTIKELKKFDQNHKPGSKTYSYLLALIETEEDEVFDYNIDTIFI